MKRDIYIGLMSGTSMDAIDAVAVSFSSFPLTIIAQHCIPFSPELKHDLLALCHSGSNEIERMAQMDNRLAKLYAQAVNVMLDIHRLDRGEVVAIGSHGQTIRHEPQGANPFTLQIGNPAMLAHLTGITTVADFRRRDIAAGGQGAPLVPAFHKAIFRSDKLSRVVVNIGGMANITILPAAQDQMVMGFDTGPGNVLMDGWIRRCQGLDYDDNGQWASRGAVNAPLFNACISEPYFSLSPPKSTGRELFDQQWLDRAITLAGGDTIVQKPEDVQATLCELTAWSIAQSILKYAPSADEVFVCGGGYRNGHLMRRLASLLPAANLAGTDQLGLHPDLVEATAFAWLAKQTMNGLPGNLPSVTGALQSVILGAIYPA